MNNAVYEELDMAKAELEKLREQYRVKLEFSERLKRSHEDQLSKYKEANSKLEKLARDLNEKDDEIYLTKQMYDDVKSKLTEKESIIKHLISTRDKVSLDFTEKLRMFEEENKALASSLDDANVRNIDKEKEIDALKQEIEDVKRVLIVYEKKRLNTVYSTERSKETSEDVWLRLEEEKRKFEDQLKWKKEQFVHLEEAYKKLRNELKTKENEWEKEKNALLDDISSLQMNLDSQVIVSQDLQWRVEMCNEALAHNESKRKLLEAELLESRASFDNVCGEYEVAKSNFENLIGQRDREIATLRSSLVTKEIVCKEIEYQSEKLERENRDLLVTVKELQEDRIVSSCSKDRNKLKSSGNVHKGCLTNLKAREGEWRCEMEKLTEELNFCKEELKSKDMSLLNLELINQETSIMMLVLKSGFFEARLGICGLVEELEKKKDALKRVQNELDEEHEKVVILAKNEQILEEMLKGSSSTCQVDQIRTDLEKVNEELYEKYCEASEIEFELHKWKSSAEKMEVNLNQSLRMRREIEASLLAQVHVEMNLKREKEDLRHLLQAKEKRISELEQQLVEPSRREISYRNLLEEKDERIYDLQKLVTSLESEFESSTGSFSSKLSQMQKEMKLFQEKIKETEVLKEIEIQEKNMVIFELENDLCSLKDRVEHREKGVVEMEKMVHERIERLIVDDMEIMRSLGKIVETIDVNEPREVEGEDCLKENMEVFFCSSPSMKKVEAIHEERLPFRAIN